MFNTKNFNKKNLNYILKWLEIIFLIVIGVLAIRITYFNICNSYGCIISRPNQSDFLFAIKIIFPLFGLFNSLRIGLSFLINDTDPDPEDFFYLSLIGLLFSYGISGLFFENFNQISNREIAQSGVFILNLFILGLVCFLLFQEKSLWTKSTGFVRTRLGLSLLHLVALAVNPGIGLFLTAIFFPLMIFWKEQMPVLKDESSSKGGN
jgi:hypothetical protein